MSKSSKHLLMLAFVFSMALFSNICRSEAMTNNFIGREIYVKEGAPDTALGTKEDPVGSLDKAQSLANGYVEAVKAKGYLDNPLYEVNVSINVEGTFKCQKRFDWIHSYKNLNLFLRSVEGKTAEFYGHINPCYENNSNGNIFFVAKANPELSGFGIISIQGLTIKYYGMALKLNMVGNNNPYTEIDVLENTFYKLGQIVNPEHWDPLYAAIVMNNVDRAQIHHNLFQYIANVDHPNMIHGLYVSDDSDGNVIADNTFKNISGMPIKYRNSSDDNVAKNNRFIKGNLADHIYPVQDWYKNWYKPEPEEKPSFNNLLKDNTYEGGYISEPVSVKPAEKDVLCRNRTIATPYADKDGNLPQSYTDEVDLHPAAQGVRLIKETNGVRKTWTAADWNAMGCTYN